MVCANAVGKLKTLKWRICGDEGDAFNKILFSDNRMNVEMELRLELGLERMRGFDIFDKRKSNFTPTVFGAEGASIPKKYRRTPNKEIQCMPIQCLTFHCGSVFIVAKHCAYIIKEVPQELRKC